MFAVWEPLSLPLPASRIYGPAVASFVNFEEESLIVGF